ncbi:alpha/beta hydrolase [Streptomyces prunicolor]|uniref:alpha/beta fold hydrolase n=1 Tax=Streptomyces prunicolor TaxID=67348 RepID=UPI0022583513|nr:alpha/beta hydrolase [Streptomyces prunicolor]MCX5243024.1 alpha/beta hydrolase [Streptomyces prunicolor]
MTESWDVRRAGPADAAHRVLMIPGGMCTAEFYAEVMAEPALAELELTAVTMPGFGATKAPADVTMDNYARLMAGYVAEARSDVLVGHSLGANLAIEMAAAGLFTGPLVLLSPSFSRGDESTFLAVMDVLGRVPVLGNLAWTGMLKLLPRAMKNDMLKRLPPERAQALADMMGGNDPANCRRIVRGYYAYLDRHRALPARLCASGVPAWVVRGDHDEIGLTDAERRELEACPQVRMVTVPDAGHLVLLEQPAHVADVVLAAARLN